VEKLERHSFDHIAILRGVWRRHKRLVGGIFLGLAVPLLALVYLFSQPLYESLATIAIDSPPVEQIPLLRELPRRDSVATQQILLRSRSLAEGVVEALPKESFEELLTYSQHKDYMLALTNAIKRWLGKPLTVMSPQQRAVAELQKARMQFVPSRESFGILHIRGTASNPRVAMDLVNTHIQVLLSRTKSGNQEEARKAREFLEQQVQQVKEALSQADETLAKFQEQKGRIRLGRQTELDMVRLSQMENALAEAQASREVLVARIAGLRRQLEQGRAKDSRGSAEPQGRGGEESPAAAPPADASARFNAFRIAQERLAKLEARLAAMRERYTEAHPQVQVTQDELAKERLRVAQLARELPVAPSTTEPRSARTVPAPPSDRAEAQRQLATLEAEDAALQSRVETLKIQADRLRKDLRNLSQDEVEFSMLRRNVEANRNLLTVLSDKLMTARIREQGEPGVVRIIDPASFPLQPTQSKTQKLILLVLVLAGGVGLGVAYGIEFWRQPIETEEDVRKTTSYAVLGSVGVIRSPATGSRRRRSTPPSDLPVHLPSSSQSSAIHMQLYRAIRASVETERLKTPFRSILVTSPGPSEGKSTTVLNLAHVLQEFGRRVLIVEADLRRPMLAQALGVTNEPGLVDFLEGAATFEQICRSLPSGVTVIPGQISQKDVASVLGPSRTKDLLKQAKAHYDTILFDSAPLLAVPDNLMLVTTLDRIILVLRASQTSKRDLRKAQMILNHANAQVLGVVLNQADPHDVHYYHRRYGRYHRTSSEEMTEGDQRRFPALAWIGKKTSFGGPSSSGEQSSGRAVERSSAAQQTNTSRES
jgi:capsular exopolysaccharide synthesis family protein